MSGTYSLASSANSRIISSSGDRRAVRLLVDDAQATVAGDAVLDVDDVIADGEIAEVGDKGRRLRLAAYGPRLNVGVVVEIVRAEEDELARGRAIEIEHLHAIRDGSAHDAPACADRRRDSSTPSRRVVEAP